MLTTNRGNQSFPNRFNNFTLIVGKENPGAIGIDYITCNGGPISQVSVVSEDKEQPALTGIYTEHSDNGPHLIRDVQITGFQQGMHLESWFWANILVENLTLQRQSQYGLLHESSVLSLAGMDAQEPDGVSAVINRSVMSLVDATLAGHNGKAAVINEAKLFARNVKFTGYAATEDFTGKADRCHSSNSAIRPG